MNNQTPSVPTEEVVDMSPFKRMVITLGTLPNAFIESMTYYEALAYFVKYLEENVIPAINQNAEATKELQRLYVELKEYVDNYFADLDIQEEIDTKLDEMAESGELAEIISLYLNSNCMRVFPTVNDMVNSDSFVENSTVQTLGFYSIGDGGGATYRIKTSLTANNYTVFELPNDLFAELIPEYPFNLRKIGAKADGETDNYGCLSFAIDFLKDKETTMLYIPSGDYLVSSNIVIDYPLSIIGDCSQGVYKTGLNTIQGGGTTILDGTNDNSAPFIKYISTDPENQRIGGFLIKNIAFRGQNKVHECLYLVRCGWRSRIENVNISYFRKSGVVLDECWDMCFDNSQIISSSGIGTNKTWALTTLGNTNSISFDSCQIEGGDWLMKLTGTHLHFNNCHIEYNGVYQDYSDFCILIMLGSKVNFNNCLFATQNILDYNTNSYDSIKEFMGVQNNAIVRINNSEFVPVGEGLKVCKPLFFNSNDGSVSINNTRFTWLTVRTNSITLNRSFMNNVIFEFKDNNTNGTTKGVKLVQGNKLNNIKTLSTNVNSNNGAAFEISGNYNEIHNIFDLTSYDYIYTRSDESYFGKYDKQIGYTSFNSATYPTITGNVYDAANIVIPINRRLVNTNKLELAFTQSTTLKGITNALIGDEVYVCNPGVNSAVVTLDTSSTGGFFASGTIQPGETKHFVKMGGKWREVN